MTARVLVIGREGQLARELARARWPDGWSPTFAGRPELDLRFPDKAAAEVTASAADLVVNAAAYTNVDQAESEPDIARLVNAAGPGAIATACGKIGATLVSISTDYIFDGTKAGPYLEEDPVNPIGAYGRSKAEGEALIRAAWAEHLILRTSWVFSPFGTNFVKTMLRLGSERPQLRIVADQRGCPTGARDLAGAVIGACTAVKSAKAGFGTYHVANSGATTWYDLAARYSTRWPRAANRCQKSSLSRPRNIRRRRHGRRTPCSTADGCKARSALRFAHGRRRWRNA